MKKAVWGAVVRVATAAALILASASCGDTVRQGQASSYLMVTALVGASGAAPGEFSGDVRSDVITVVDGAPTVFNDLGQVTLTLAMKDVGSVGSPSSPTPNNFITVDRYQVRFIRSDGRNVEGVDVPYAFEGAFTVTVSDSAQVAFTLVRNQAKLEAPLRALVSSPVLISTIAEVTFYGRDQTGRTVSASGRIGVSFGNFGDPASGS
jgi:hypothetical protein